MRVSRNADQPERGRVSLTLDAHQPDTGPRYVVTIEDDEADARTVEIVIEDDLAEGGGPKVSEVTVRKQAGVASRDIRIPLDRYLEQVSGTVAGLLGGPEDVSRVTRWTLSPWVERLTAPIGRRQRRELTDDFLRDVANAYRAGGIAAVSEERDARFAASDATKFRWVKAARERGLLDDGGDGGER